MNRATIAVALSLVAFSVTAGAPPHGPAALRDLAVSPKIDITLGFTLKFRDGQEVMVENKDLSGDIYRLKTALKEQPGDIRRMTELAELLDETDATNESRPCWQNVEKLARQRLEANDADGLLLMQLGEALSSLGRNAEAESDYRRAVAVASNDWKCWAGLGIFLQGRACAVLVPKQLAGRVQASPNPVPQEWLDCHPSSEALQQCEALRHEAGLCLDRVATLAPKEPVAWVQLATYVFSSNWLSRLITHFKGQDPTPLDSAGLLEAYVCTDGVADLRHAAELGRTNYTLIAAAGLFTIMGQHLLRADASPDSRRESVRQEILLLENLSRQPNKKAAAKALEALGVVQVMIGDLPGASASAREAVAEDPTLDSAWDLLFAASGDAASPEELVALCQSRLKQADTARNRLYLAKLFLNQQKPEKADEQTQSILKIEPNNLTAYIILAASELKRSENPRFMAAAQQHLLRAQELFQAAPGGAEALTRWREIDLNVAIWCGLQSDPENRRNAKSRIEEVLQRMPEDQTAKDILRALE
jgi:tetratricopeptide (TPR) repeat protein